MTGRRKRASSDGWLSSGEELGHRRQAQSRTAASWRWEEPVEKIQTSGRDAVWSVERLYLMVVDLLFYGETSGNSSILHVLQQLRTHVSINLR